MEEYFLEIDRRGVKKSRRKLGERLRGFLRDIAVVRYIVASELRARVFDKALGMFWLLLEPLIIAGLYYLLTVVVFKQKVESNHFLFILVAVVFWRWFSKSVDNSPNMISGYGGILKQTNFPVHLLILVSMGTEFVMLGFGFLVLLVMLCSYGMYPNLAYIYLPFVMAAQFFFILPFVLLFSVLGTFFKDLGGFLYAFTSVWFYLSPGIYPTSRIPAKYMWVYKLNPFAHIFPAYRDILIRGKRPELLSVALILGVSALFTVLCFKLLNKVKSYFFMYL